MALREGLVGLGLLAALVTTSGAVAQYYPPPGYYPRPVIRLGGRCDARVPTAYGPRRLICPIVRARPLGRSCVCPPPASPPGYRPGPYLNGRVIP